MESSELQMYGQLCRSPSPYVTRLNMNIDHALCSCAVRHSYVKSSELLSDKKFLENTVSIGIAMQ